MANWEPGFDRPVSVRLFCGEREPWPEGLTDWHARRRVSELRAERSADENFHYCRDEVKFTISRVLRALDRKFVGLECREIFAERGADWIMSIPSPADHTENLRRASPHECQQALIAGLWKAQSLVERPPARVEQEPSFFGDAA